MKYVIKLFPEIMLKSKSIRLKFIKILIINISNIVKKYDNLLKLKYYWDYIEFIVKDKKKIDVIKNCMTKIPGIQYILTIKSSIFHKIIDVYNSIYEIYNTKLVNKSFCIRIKRQGKHNFTSQELIKYIGNLLIQQIINTYVDLVNPDFLISLEIKNNILSIIIDRLKGIGGFPVGTQGNVLSLISGGFDSSVSSYMFIRRGCKVNYCFFNISANLNYFHQKNIRELIYYLWNNFSASHKKIKFFEINFISMINEIFKKIDKSKINIIMKRLIIKTASIIAEKYNIQALVTGDSLGQVSSQTMHNIQLTNDISKKVIFRPLITYDKEDIIKLSRKIGTEQFVKNIPEYCNLSIKPVTHPKENEIKLEEEKIDFSILDLIIKKIKVINVCHILIKNYFLPEIEIVNKLNSNNIVILDIRKSSSNSLNCKNVEIQKVPFYNLKNYFLNIANKNKMYLLYCDNNMVSKTQFIYLRTLGFLNVKVYIP